MKLVKVLFFAFTLLSGLPQISAQVASSLPALSANTVVPPLIHYAGIAKDGEGRPLAGELGVSFLVYKDEEGGAPLWVESQTVQFDSTGHYDVRLGGASPAGLPIDLFSSGEARWLDIQIAGQKPQPRVLLVSVPYALKAADAETLGGLPASAFALAGGRLTSDTGRPATSVVTSDASTAVTTTGGVSGYVPIFTGTSAIADSTLFQGANGFGIGITTPTTKLDVSGASTFRGNLNLYHNGTATSSAGVNSFPIVLSAQAYNSSSAAVVVPAMELKAEVTGNNTAAPGATLNLLYNSGSGGAETGFYINPNGTVHFVPSQTFPGSGGTITGVTAGSDLLGGGTSGTVTLSLDTSKVPVLAANNHFTGAQSVTGAVGATGSLSSASQLISTVATGTAPIAVSSTTVVPNLNASLLGGFAAGSFAGTGTSNSFTATQTFSKIGIGTTTPRSALEISATAVRALGPVFTLTNTSGGSGAEDAIDFNTIVPSTTGTYNPMARIAAMDALHFSDTLAFQSNIAGALNDSLQTNMVILSGGQVGINTTAPGAQLEVDANATLGTDALYSYGATTTSGAGTLGIEAQGGPSISSNAAGSGASLTGGYAEDTGNGGDGVDAFAGGTADSGASAGYAGNFSGDVTVSGVLSAGAKNFEIDHPLDPANKYLDHASVESSEMVNIYSGNITTDELGIATVHLPEWFEAENRDFRYQLTVIGKFAQAIVSEEITNHAFKVSTNAAFTKVSWQVTGVRQDAFAKAHPLVVERNKTASERGFYSHPELYGQPAEKQLQWARHPEMMRRMKASSLHKRLDVAKAATP